MMERTADEKNNGGASARRRSVLELAPLELDCMNALWPMGEGTVREIRDRLAPRRPRAYTTIMTIMDRLARKGIVERRKVGRAYRYRANLSAEDARTHAVEQVVDHFFAGSPEALEAELRHFSPAESRLPPAVREAARPVAPARRKTPRVIPSEGAPAPPMDETLL